MIKKGDKGIKVLTYYTIFLALAYLMFAVTNQTTLIFGMVVSGGWAVITNVIFLVIIFAIIHGLMVKTPHTYELALAWFGFEILNSIITMYVQGGIFSIIKDIISAAFAFIILIDALIIWYLIEVKLHFKHGKYNPKYDNFFVNALTTLMVFAVIVTFVFATVNYLNVTKETDKVISQLRLKTYSQAKEVCKTKADIEKDVCYLTLVAIYEQANILDCDNIESTFYKFSCIRSIE